MHGRTGQVGDQGTGAEPNNDPVFVGEGAATKKFGELGGNQPMATNQNKFAGNASIKLASNGNG